MKTFGKRTAPAFAGYREGRRLANDEVGTVPKPTRGDLNCERSQQSPGFVLGDASGRFVCELAGWPYTQLRGKPAN